MHPSLQAKYRLRTAEDVAIAEHFLAAAKGAGWSDEQSHGLLQYYATIAPNLESGQITPNDALNQLWDFAALKSVSEDQREPLIEWHESTADHLEKYGEPPTLAKPSAEEARRELAEIEEIQRTDPHRYWRDNALQNRMYDLLEQTRRSPAPVAHATSAHLARLDELESMMGDKNSAYWAKPTAETLQAEYRNILSLAAPEGAAPTPGADAGTTTEGT